MAADPAGARAAAAEPGQTAARPLRVLLLVSDLEYGGAQRQVVELANNLDAARYAVTVCSLSGYVPLAQRIAQPEQRVRVIRKRFRYDATVIPRLARLLRALEIDVLHSFLFDADIAGRLAGRLAGTPVVLGSERNADYQLGAAHKAAYRLTSRWVDAIVANSRAGARFNSSLLNCDPARYRVIHNGVDTAHFRPLDRDSIRAGIGIARGAPVVGMFASFKRQKNHPLLFAAAARVAAVLPELRLLLVGDSLHGGREGSDAYKRSVERLIDALGLRQRCLFLGNRDDLAELYNACDLTVLPSLHEGTPNVVLESMACGVPAVVTDVADNAIIVRDGLTGCVVPSGDEGRLAARLLSLLQDTAARVRMGRAARESIERHFSSRCLAENTGKVYAELLARADS